MTLDPGSGFGRYRLLGDLGRGGEATVHLAEDPVLGRRVAIKIFPPSITGGEGAQRFRREVSVLGRLEHPGVCRLHDAGVIDGSPFIAMTYFEGLTLADTPRPGAEESVALVAKVAAIVQAVHEAGVVHGDVKPANILVTPDGRCVLLDFGVARLLDEAGGSGTGERPAGTLPYLAPECLVGPAGLGSDVFGLGAVLFELVTGRTPFAAPTRAALADLIMHRDPPLARSVERSVSRDLEAVLARALHRDPAHRYPSAQALADDLARLTRHDPVQARRYGPMARGWRWARARPALATLAAFVFGFLAIAVPTAAVKNRDLEEYRDRAAEAAQRSRDDARDAAEHVLRAERLADRRRLEDLQERSRRLVPPRQEIMAALADWLADASALVKRLDEHERTLRELRARGTKRGEEVSSLDAPVRLRREIAALEARDARLKARVASESREEEQRPLAKSEAYLRKIIGILESALPRRDAWTYSSPSDAWQDATLSALVDDLRRFADRDRLRGTIADVSSRLEEAKLVTASLEQHRDSWERARASIANKNECPRYAGLVITPQPGLVPIRRNPDTGLWEFLHILTGSAPEPERQLTMSADEGIVLVLLPGGVTRMGAVRPRPGEPEDGPHVDPLAAPEEGPIDEVTLDPFFISKFEMTQAQWLSTQGTRPQMRLLPTSPIILIDWFETTRVLSRIGLCLPTEAQWEYATRGGTTTPWWTGTDPDRVRQFEVYKEPDPRPVGELPGNPFGLHDCAGNVSEWCRDLFARYEDPKAAGDGERAGLDEVDVRVRRGGSNGGEVWLTRSARRNVESPYARRASLGVRPARRLER